MMNGAHWRQIGMENDDVIELLETQDELALKPGSGYAYSNSGYTILTEVIEQVSGKKFNDYSEEFFAALGMNHTAFVRRYMGLIPNRADSYSDCGDRLWLATPTVSKSNGDGFLYTTLRDQLIFEQAVQNAEANNNVLLVESQKPIPNSEIKSYGFSLELDGRLGRVAQYHSGSTFGYNSHTSRFPEEKLFVFVMSNNGSIWSGNIADKVASLLLPAQKKKVEYNRLIDTVLSGKEQPQMLGQYMSPDGFLNGKGNYDMFVIKTDKDGKKQWQNTYGGFYNEYDYLAEETTEGYVIKGTKQGCTSNSDVFNRTCTTNVWFVSIDKKGKEISNILLEEI